MKTTKKQFELFKSECERIIDKWGITGWRIEYLHDKNVEDERASIGSNLLGKAVTFYFPVNWKDTINPNNQIIINSAKHEVCHFLAVRLRTLAVQRFTSEDEVYEANEELARLIENAVKKGF